MSNIDKQALREAAEKATKGQWQFHDRQSLSHSGSGFVAIAGKEAILCFNAPVGGINQSNNVVKYIAAANPATVLALLDELDAKDRRIAELERKEQHSERQSVIDALAGSGEEWSDIEEYMQKWDAERASAAGKGE
ncbi:ead/Ea22-like family protein [Enterobacter asburiae]|uniref:ead/Ea22-like family protein n=1 Tax=Enterobacter asburiae TaxID=61645 RepID=UPI000FD89508|nr:ead/Ea22-like family protein [Enterobacter asburiae]